MALERGALLHNRYRILEILGQGGMGSIYRAVDDNLGVEVAVKENLFTTDEYARQFRREATILAGLRHSNLPRVSDHFVIEGQGQYLVMDYIEGEDLRERMDRIGVITEAEAQIIGVAICDALSYMHNQTPPILHRDIKPGNVKISPDGKVYLVDFGLAKVAFTGQRTTTGARAMTPGYSPPEQYGGARTDHRSDVYSLAATLYASIAGVVPEDSLARTMDQVDLTPLRNRNSQVTRRFSKILEKALAVHPDDRYQTAEEFKEALLGTSASSKRKIVEQGVLDPLGEDEDIERLPADRISEDYKSAADASEPSGPLPVSTPLDSDEFSPKPRPRPNRARGCSTAFILLIVLIAAGAGIAYALYPDLPQQLIAALPENETSETDTPEVIVDEATESDDIVVAQSSPTTAPSLTSTAVPTSTEIPPTQTSIATNTSVPTSTATHTPSNTRTQTSTPTKISTATSAVSPSITPEGGGHGQIAFASDRTGIPQIWIIDSKGTGLRQITNSQWGACQPDWSPDGEQLVFISPCEENKEIYDTASLFLINVDGSGLEPLLTTDGGGFDPAWSPDGKSIVFTSLRTGFRPQIYKLDLETKEVLRLSVDEWRDYQPEWAPDGSKVLYVTTRNGPYQIWTMNPDGSEQVRFSASRSLWDTYPVWSPDGSVIIFTQRPQGGVPQLIGARYPDGGTAEFKIYPFHGAVPMREADFSPDGYWLAFESWPKDSQHDIYIMSPTGSDLTQLTFDPAFDFDATWRPVGP